MLLVSEELIDVSVGALIRQDNRPVMAALISTGVIDAAVPDTVAVVMITRLWQLLVTVVLLGMVVWRTRCNSDALDAWVENAVDLELDRLSGWMVFRCQVVQGFSMSVVPFTRLFVLFETMCDFSCNLTGGLPWRTECDVTAADSRTNGDCIDGWIVTGLEDNRSSFSSKRLLLGRGVLDFVLMTGVPLTRVWRPESGLAGGLFSGWLIPEMCTVWVCRTCKV